MFRQLSPWMAKIRTRASSIWGGPKADKLFLECSPDFDPDCVYLSLPDTAQAAQLRLLNNFYFSSMMLNNFRLTCSLFFPTLEG